jgi:hypothetical protein
MTSRSTKETLSWLNGNPPLHELMERYPAEWLIAGRELTSVIEDGRAQKLNEFSIKARAESEIWKNRVRKSRGNFHVVESALPHLIRSRMALLALDQCYLAAATGKASGKIRFNLVNGFIIQRLLFSRHLTRKMASLSWFKFWWRWITQKRLLMPLVQRRGIYCFYTRTLIVKLAELIGGRSCLEIAAGDGTLARFLAEAGVRMQATDDCSWSHAVQYPDGVEKLDAKQALEKYGPQVVICSWPPPGNPFERYVFTTRSVEMYIVIGSRYPFASGNWEAYAAQKSFFWGADQGLSACVLPPELDSAVLLFRREKIL